MSNERSDGTSQTLSHCLIRNPEFVSELLGRAASRNVVVSHLDGEHDRFPLWFAQAVPRTDPGVRRIVYPDDFRGYVRVLTTGLILAQSLVVRESYLEIPSVCSSSRTQYLPLIVQDTLKETILARVPIEPEQGPIFKYVYLCYTVDGWGAMGGIKKLVSDRFVDPKERHGSVPTWHERFEFDSRGAPLN